MAGSGDLRAVNIYWAVWAASDIQSVQTKHRLLRSGYLQKCLWIWSILTFGIGAFRKCFVDTFVLFGALEQNKVTQGEEFIAFPGRVAVQRNKGQESYLLSHFLLPIACS